MPHIHNQPGQHDATIGAYIVRVDSDEPRALLHMHKKLGKLLPIGGHVELDESIWSALAHELREESGYNLSQLSVMQPKDRFEPDLINEIVIHPQPLLVNVHDYSPTHFHNDTCYFFTTNQDPAGKPDDGESLDLRWLTKHDIDNLTDNDIFPNTKIIYQQIFERYLTAWEPVSAETYSIESIVKFGVPDTNNK